MRPRYGISIKRMNSGTIANGIFGVPLLAINGDRLVEFFHLKFTLSGFTVGILHKVFESKIIFSTSGT